RAVFRLVVQKDPVGARADVEAALKLNPETFWALYIRAVLFDNAGKQAESIADFTAALRLDPTHPYAWSQRSNSYGGRGDFHQVISDATHAIELGADWGGYTNRGMAHASLGEYAKALADYDTAAKLAPNNPRIFSQRSAVHAKMGHDDL